MKDIKLRRVPRNRVFWALLTRMSVRKRIFILAGAPVIFLTIWSLLSAMRAPKIEAEITRDLSALRDVYSDPMYTLYGAVGQSPELSRGNVDARTQELIMAHMNKHSMLLSDQLSSYKADLLASEVEKIRELARVEIENGSSTKDGKLPTDKIGDINFQSCIESSLQRKDCIYIRYMGDGIARMTTAHETSDYALFIDGERIFLAALGALGTHASVEPDFTTTKQTLQTYRSAIHQVLQLNKMWLGNIEPLQTQSPALDTQDIESRINKTSGQNR